MRRCDEAATNEAITLFRPGFDVPATLAQAVNANLDHAAGAHWPAIGSIPPELVYYRLGADPFALSPKQ